MQTNLQVTTTGLVEGAAVSASEGASTQEVVVVHQTLRRTGMTVELI
jgi:hypothetical protein